MEFILEQSISFSDSVEIMLSGDAISKLREAGQKKQGHTNTGG
jgi:hypothetical protein